MKRIQRRQALRLGAAAASGLLASGLAAQSNAGIAETKSPRSQSLAGCFHAYDNTIYSNVDVGTLAGIPNAGILYAHPGWNDLFLSGATPSESSFKHAVELKSTAPGPFILDFEVMYLSGSAAQVQQNYTVWAQLLDWANEVLDDLHPGKILGAWALVDTATLDSAYLDLAQDLTNRCGAIFQSMYTYDETETHWYNRLLANEALGRQVSSTKPILAYLWPQYSHNYTFLTGARWRAELDACLTHADGFVIWNSGASNTVTNTAWVDQTVDFINDLPNPPGTC